MRLLFLIVILDLWSLCLCGQDQVEALRKRVTQTKGVDKIDALNKLALETSTSANRESRKASEEAYRLSMESGYEKGMALALLYMSLSETNDGQFRKANDLLFKSIRLSHQLKDEPLEGYGYTWLSSNFQNNGMPDSARYFFVKARALLEKGDNLYYQTFLYNTLSDFYTLQNQPDSQYFYIKKSWEIRKRLPEKRYLVFAGNKLAEFHIRYHDYNLALAYLDSSQVSIGSDTTANEAIAKIWSNRAIVYTRLSDYKRATFYFDKARDFYSQNLFPRELNNLLLTFTEIYEEISNYEASLQHGFEALAMAEQNHFNLEKTKALIRIGWTYFNKRNYSLSVKYTLQAIESSLKFHFTTEEATASNLYGQLLIERNPKMASHYLKRALIIRLKNKSLPDQGEVYGMLGNLAIRESKYDSALYYQLLGLNIYLRTPDLLGTAYSFAGVGYAYGKLQNYRQADHYLKLAEAMAERVKSGTVMIEILRYRREIAKDNNDLKAYVKYTNDFETLSDSLFHYSESNRVLLAESLAEIQKKNSEIRLQKAKLENQEKELIIRRWQIFLISIGGILIIIIAVILFRGYKATKKLNYKIIEQNNDLAASQEEIQTQNEELLVANEEISSQRDLIEAQRNHLDLKNHELQGIVEERTKDLVQYIQQLEQFAFISSHNLRAPIARILGLGNLLNLNGLGATDSAVIHQALIQSTRELDDVIKDLNIVLEIRRNDQIVLTPILLSEEIKKVRTSLLNQITVNEATIYEDFSEADEILTFRPYVQSILLNLVSNGLKYRRPDVTPIIRVKSLNQKNFVCLQISDNGLGLDLKKYGDKLFTMYKRFHTHVEGKGLGLYMVKTQVETIGGKIEVESEVNTGTTFYVFLKKEINESSSAL
jgi:signal transduction histidine kinase